MLPGEQKVTSGCAGSGCSWQGDGKCCWRGTTGREQRGTSWELCSFQGGFQGGWVALVGASPQSIAPESWLAASPHPRPSGKRKQHVPRVCRAVPALLSPAARMVPAPVPPEPPGESLTWGAGSCGVGPCGGPCATSAPSNQPQALAMETSLIFNNIRTAKIPLRLCGQCRGMLRHGGGHSTMEGDTPPWRGTQQCPRAPLASPGPSSAPAPAAACAQGWAAHLSQFK